MQKKQIVIGVWLVFLSIIIAAPSNIFGSETANTAPQDQFSKEELDQMLAPIALYPDTLLTQMLMAATYPLEIVEAARWIGNNPNLKDDLLDQALQDKDWDVSVKSLVHFPDVLAMMDERIEWTARVGDAFLAQQDDVMDAIQELRSRAEAEGNLSTTREQRVVVEGETIEIEPAVPGVIYVPVYDPFWVYGSWWYPSYPPYVFYYPGVAVRSGVFGFAFGFATGFGFGWCDWDWHHHDIRIDYDRIGRFHRFDRNRHHGWQRWEHDPGHRRGVAYWDRETSHRFGQSPERSIQGRPEARGYRDQGVRRGTEAGTPDSGQAVRGRPEVSGAGPGQGVRRGTEAGTPDSGQAVRGRPEVSGAGPIQGVRRGTEAGSPVSRQRVQGQPSSAFSGVRDGTSGQRASDRGQFSRGISEGRSQRSDVGSRSGSGGGSPGGGGSFGGGRTHGGGGDRGR